MLLFLNQDARSCHSNIPDVSTLTGLWLELHLKVILTENVFDIP